MKLLIIALVVISVTVITIIAVKKHRSGLENKSYRPQTGRSASRLVLDRGGRVPAKNQTSGRAFKIPLIIGVVILMLGAWLVLAYVTPEKPAPQKPDQAANRNNAPPATHSLSGKIEAGLEGEGASAPGSTPATADNNQTQNQAAASRTINQTPAVSISARADVMTEAAQSMAPQISRLEMVGRKLESPAQAPAGGSNKPHASSQTPPQAKPASAQKPNQNSPQKPAATNKPPASAGTAQAAKPETNKTAAVQNAGKTAPDPKPKTIDNKRSGQGILTGQGSFTVHLASFGERSNAEKYKNKLTAAGVQAFVSESTINGRLWFRVMSGRFASRSAADAHGRSLKQGGLTPNNSDYIIKTIE